MSCSSLCHKVTVMGNCPTQLTQWRSMTTLYQYTVVHSNRRAGWVLSYRSKVTVINEVKLQISYSDARWKWTVHWLFSDESHFQERNLSTVLYCTDRGIWPFMQKLLFIQVCLSSFAVTGDSTSSTFCWTVVYLPNETGRIFTVSPCPLRSCLFQEIWANIHHCQSCTVVWTQMNPS